MKGKSILRLRVMNRELNDLENELSKFNILNMLINCNYILRSLYLTI